MSVRTGSLAELMMGTSGRKRRNGYGSDRPKITVKSRRVKSRTNRNRNARPTRHVSLPGISAGGIGRMLSRLLTVALCAALVLSVCVGLLAGYRWLTTIKYFALQQVSVTGCSRVSPEHIEEVAGLTPGVNVLSLSLDRIRAKLAHEPWIESVSVKRVLPGSVQVAIKEKTPSYLVQYQGTLYYADEAGRIIEKVEPGQFVSLPQIEIEAGMEKHLDVLADLRQAIVQHRVPFEFSQIAWLRLSWSRGLEIRLMDSGILLCLGSRRWQRNLSRLNLVWTDLRRRGELGKVALITAEGDKVWVEKRVASGEASQG